MNCPCHCLIYKADAHSYRDLPIRLADFSVLHRCRSPPLPPRRAGARAGGRAGGRAEEGVLEYSRRADGSPTPSRGPLAVEARTHAAVVGRIGVPGWVVARSNEVSGALSGLTRVRSFRQVGRLARAPMYIYIYIYTGVAVHVTACCNARDATFRRSRRHVATPARCNATWQRPRRRSATRMRRVRRPRRTTRTSSARWSSSRAKSSSA